MTNTTAIRTLIIAVVVTAAAVAAVFITTRPTTDTPAPSDPPSVAAAFVTAYQQGDTPAMCNLSTGDALTNMRGPGWCDTRQGWVTTATMNSRCGTPDGRQVFVYDVNPLVQGQHRMEIALANTGGGVWRVTMFGNPADRSLCDIYR